MELKGLNVGNYQLLLLHWWAPISSQSLLLESYRVTVTMTTRIDYKSTSFHSVFTFEIIICEMCIFIVKKNKEKTLQRVNCCFMDICEFRPAISDDDVTLHQPP